MYGRPAPDVPRYERLLVGAEFLASSHGKVPCQGCHSGPVRDDVDAAHRTVVRDPSLERVDVCAACHKDIVLGYEKALHNTLQGETAALVARSGGSPLSAGLSEYAEQDCATCHTTCGQCHVSRPDVAGGGLLRGHVFVKKPLMEETCLQCHGPETSSGLYTGGEGMAGDVHWTKAGMVCADCHRGAELHGDGETYGNEGEVRKMPRCADCHSEGKPKTGAEHIIHVEKVSCYVCHSGPSTSCFDCHEGTDGVAYRGELTFKVGLNVEADAQHPERYVVLRHVPVTRNTFEKLDGSLPGFDAVPTWKMSAPHNIQRVTPQTKSCNVCHGSREPFLTSDDLLPGDSAVNEKVVVPVIPRGF
ncbi:MAG: hypothetical protein AB1603_01040 [Chloroflexota bacterium]